MTLIELYDPHELAFPLVGQLEENFEIEVISEIPKDLERHKNNLLIIVGKTFAELEQYKPLKEHYLAIVVFIKDMEATQIRSLQNTEETFDAFFGIPWQKTALKFYLQDLAEYKAMELKDELELTDQVKGNQTKSAVLQNLFDQAPDDGSLVTASIDTNKNKSTDTQTEVDHQSDHSDSGIHLDLGNDTEASITRTNTATATAVQEAGELSLDDQDEQGISLELSEEDEPAETVDNEIAEEDSGEDLFDLDDGLELDFGSSSDDDQGSIAEEEEASPDSGGGLDLDDDELDFAVHSDLDNSENEEETIDENHQPSLSLSEDAVEKLKEIDKILDKDSLSESSINEIAEEDSLNLSLSDEEEKPYTEEDIGEISLSTDLEDDLDFGAGKEDDEIGEIEASPGAQSSSDEIALDEESIADEDLFDNPGSDSDEYTLAEESDLLDNSDETEAGTMMIGGTQLSNLKTPDETHDSVAEEDPRDELENEELSHPVDEPVIASTSIPRANYQNEIAHFDGDLERAAAIISELRNERDYLEKRVNELEKEKILKENSTLDMRAELSEKTIELQLIKKRHLADVNQFHTKLSEAEEAKQLTLSKNKYLEDEIKKLKTQVNFDIKKVRSRERELEDRIDLIKQDAEAQIRNRDSSIIDLKRKIDMLEFNLDNAVEKDKKHIESKFELESKVDKVMQTLRNAIGVLEDDIKNVNAEDAGENSNG